jgi:hypothetical protein
MNWHQTKTLDYSPGISLGNQRMTARHESVKAVIGSQCITLTAPKALKNLSQPSRVAHKCRRRNPPKNLVRRSKRVKPSCKKK